MDAYGDEEIVDETMMATAEEIIEDTDEEAAAPEGAAAVPAGAPVTAADAPVGWDPRPSLALAVQYGRESFMHSSAGKRPLFGLHTKRLSITHPKRVEGA